MGLLRPIPLMKSKRYAKEIGLLRAHRASGDDLDNERIKLETQKLPVIQEINNIVRTAQKLAENRLLREHPSIAETIFNQRVVDQDMKAGNIKAARRQQKKDLETRQLLQMAK